MPRRSLTGTLEDVVRRPLQPGTEARERIRDVPAEVGERWPTPMAIPARHRMQQSESLGRKLNQTIPLCRPRDLAFSVATR